MATYERLDYGSEDGSQWGAAATDRIGFYGAVPVTRFNLANVSNASQMSTVWSSFVSTMSAYGLYSTVTYVSL